MLEATVFTQKKVFMSIGFANVILKAALKFIYEKVIFYIINIKKMKFVLKMPANFGPYVALGLFKLKRPSIIGLFQG